MKTKTKITSKQLEIGGNNFTFEIGRFAEQANASVLGRYGDTMVLATVVAGKERTDIGYFPLFVEYQEKLYAGGRIKGSRWVKREGRPSEEAILNARLIDRSIRPLFPKELQSETQVIITVLSVDAENDPDILAINTVSAALAISDIPWAGPIAAVRLGFISKGKNQEPVEKDSKEETQKTGNFMVNPAYVGREYSDLDLVVSTTKENIVMVEAGANEVGESILIEAFDVAQEETKKIISVISELQKDVGKPKRPLVKKEEDEDLKKVVKKFAKDLLKDLEKPKKTAIKKSRLTT